MSARMSTDGVGLVVFAYDGSELSKLAIQEAAVQLRARDALVLTVWEPFNVQFVPAGGAPVDASAADSVRAAAEQTAAEGAALAEALGYRTQAVAAKGSPPWTALIAVADDREAGVIVLGSHGRHGISHALIGSVAEAVAQHSKRSVLIVHRRPPDDS